MVFQLLLLSCFKTNTYNCSTKLVNGKGFTFFTSTPCVVPRVTRPVVTAHRLLPWSLIFTWVVDLDPFPRVYARSLLSKFTCTLCLFFNLLRWHFIALFYKSGMRIFLIFQVFLIFCFQS